MNVLAKPRLTVDEFLSWAVEHPGRYELFRGEVIAMSPETAGHAEMKGYIYSALIAAVRQRGLHCYVLPDGMTVRIDESTAFEPDALVYCGQKAYAITLEIPNPVIVVEVLSPSSHRIDLTYKLTGYFRLPSVMHYLIVDPSQPSIIHHARGADGVILTRVVASGTIMLDPPGIELALADIYRS